MERFQHLAPDRTRGAYYRNPETHDHCHSTHRNPPRLSAEALRGKVFARAAGLSGGTDWPLQPNPWPGLFEPNLQGCS
jgi:hypothetical protein